MQLIELQQKVSPILRAHGIKRASVFGSVSRNEDRPDSDVDILIRFKGNRSLFDLSGLKIELEEKLNKKIHLVTYKYIYPKIKEQILKEEIRLL